MGFRNLQEKLKTIYCILLKYHVGQGQSWLCIKINSNGIFLEAYTQFGPVHTSARWILLPRKYFVPVPTSALKHYSPKQLRLRNNFDPETTSAQYNSPHWIYGLKFHKWKQYRTAIIIEWKYTYGDLGSHKIQ